MKYDPVRNSFRASPQTEIVQVSGYADSKSRRSSAPTSGIRLNIAGFLSLYVHGSNATVTSRYISTPKKGLGRNFGASTRCASARPV
ncbi:unnamed protein product [Macrosiphum euphorbiae]|uniref:Uncharacterized protein n=1 Tax=Macrosiphum euphorbiae TaxID=13131 RepID=A0AAV0XF65_9HEMI|nr:unnamed protein product [Macrosiphum euphorbiae]